MEEQVRELQAAVERLAQENQASMVALAESVGRLANNLQRGDRKLLIDTKGIGRRLPKRRCQFQEMGTVSGQLNNRNLWVRFPTDP